MMLMIALAASAALPGTSPAASSRPPRTRSTGGWYARRPVPAGVGAAILILGVVAFVLTGYNWLVLALIWSFGLLHIGLLVRTFRRAQNRQQARISR